MIDIIHTWRRAAALCLILVAVCYANSVSNPFIQDDQIIIQNNAEIRHVAPFRFLQQPYALDTRLAGVYRPFTIFSFSLDYAVWHDRAFGFRLTNLLLHALNGFLVFLIAETMLSAIPAAVAASVYLVHPVHTEAVVGIVGRGELLAAACFLSSWLLFRKGRTLWSSLLFFFGLLAKEHVIMFPAVAALDVALLQRDPRKILREWRRFSALALAALAYLTLRYWVLGTLVIPHAAQYKSGMLSALELRMTAGRAFLQYLRLVFAPIHVAGVYEFNSIPTASIANWDAWLGLILAAAAVGFAIAIARKRAIASFTILFFFVMLFPTSNWVIPIGALMAERFMYTPVVGVALLAALAWQAFPAVRIRHVAEAGLLATAVSLCIAHNYIWHDPLSFYGNMVRQFPENMSGRLGYGLALLDRGSLPEAEEQFEYALRIAPTSPTFIATVAGRISQGNPARCEQSRPLLDVAFKFQPNHWQSYWVLANCAYAKARFDEAIDLYKLAAQYAPAPNADLFFSWGIAAEKAGKYREAIEIYRRASEIDPNDAEIRAHLQRLNSKPADPPSSQSALLPRR
jgi:protein O-mannosyl-transferase